MSEVSPPMDPGVEVLATDIAHPESFARAIYHQCRAGDSPGAIDLGATALQLYPNHAPIWDAVALALRYPDRLEDAEAFHRRAVALEPNNPGFKTNLAMTLIDLGRTQEASTLLREVLNANPFFQYAGIQLMLAELMSGNLEEGWKVHGQRLGWHAYASQIRDSKLPTWDGKSKGKILLLGEEGAGERMMYASMFQEVMDSGNEIVIECCGVNGGFKRFARLMERSFPQAEISLTPGSAKADYQLAMGSLAPIFRPTWDHFPKHRGYLKANPARTEQLRRKINAKGLSVGISWKSGSTNLMPRKSLPIHAFKQILGIDNITFVNLQFGETVDDRNSSHEAMSIVDTGVDLYNDMEGVASLMKACDLVITVSNTNAHLAGALGIPTWILVPARTGRMWFWGLNRDDCPWYPSVKLFRQEETWGPTLAKLHRSLLNLQWERQFLSAA